MNDLCNHSGDNENCIILRTFCKLDFMLIHTVRLATSDKKKLRVRTRVHKPVLLFIQSTYRRNACCLLDSTLQSPAAFWQYWINVVFLRLLNIQQGELNFINKKKHKNQTWILQDVDSYWLSGSDFDWMLLAVTRNFAKVFAVYSQANRIMPDKPEILYRTPAPSSVSARKRQCYICSSHQYQQNCQGM